MKKRDKGAGQMSGAGTPVFAEFLRTRGGIVQLKIPFMVQPRSSLDTLD